MSEEEMAERIFQLEKELNEKNKVIKLMTNYLAKEDISEAFCKTEYKNIDCSEKDYRCEDCIKEYFYKKAEEQQWC